LNQKFCFMNAQRPCDLTCKAAFEVDDPVDNIDCYFIWLAYHFGEGFYEIKRSLEGIHGAPGFPGMPGMGGQSAPSSPSSPPFKGPKGPKGPSGN
jgi:hypothetical protein